MLIGSYAVSLLPNNYLDKKKHILQRVLFRFVPTILCNENRLIGSSKGSRNLEGLAKINQFPKGEIKRLSCTHLYLISDKFSWLVYNSNARFDLAKWLRKIIGSTWVSIDRLHHRRKLSWIPIISLWKKFTRVRQIF